MEDLEDLGIQPTNRGGRGTEKANPLLKHLGPGMTPSVPLSFYGSTSPMAELGGQRGWETLPQALQWPFSTVGRGTGIREALSAAKCESKVCGID